MSTHLDWALAVAVPLEIQKLNEQPDWALDDMAEALDAGLGLQKGADAMQFGTGQPGEITESFAAHTRALALLAIRAEGGVDFRGQHWCADFRCRATSRYDHAPDTGDAEPPKGPVVPAPRAIHDVALTGTHL